MKKTHSPDTRNVKTEALISALALQAGEPADCSTAYQPVSLRYALPAALALSAIIAFLVVFIVIGARPDLGTVSLTWMFQFKLASMMLLGIGAAKMVRNASIPGLDINPKSALAPGAIVIAAAVLIDPSGFPITGARALSVSICVASIILASLPGLALIIMAMRSGTATRPGPAGAMAGILAGSMGAFAYAFACVNDGAAFVALWYLLAISIVAAMGTVVGRKALTW